MIRSFFQASIVASSARNRSSSRAAIHGGGSGFSCDILCSGNGGSQRQWDVLSDAEGAQLPKWGEISPIINRPCQIQ